MAGNRQTQDISPHPPKRSSSAPPAAPTVTTLLSQPGFHSIGTSAAAMKDPPSIVANSAMNLSQTTTTTTSQMANSLPATALNHTSHLAPSTITTPPRQARSEDIGKTATEAQHRHHAVANPSMNIQTTPPNQISTPPPATALGQNFPPATPASQSTTLFRKMMASRQDNPSLQQTVASMNPPPTTPPPQKTTRRPLSPPGPRERPFCIPAATVPLQEAESHWLQFGLRTASNGDSKPSLIVKIPNRTGCDPSLCAAMPETPTASGAPRPGQSFQRSQSRQGSFWATNSKNIFGGFQETWATGLQAPIFEQAAQAANSPAITLPIQISDQDAAQPAGRNQERLHGPFRKVTIHTAKCDRCLFFNKSVVQRCTICQRQHCRKCWQTYDNLHDVSNLDWTDTGAQSLSKPRVMKNRREPIDLTSPAGESAPSGGFARRKDGEVAVVGNNVLSKPSPFARHGPRENRVSRFQQEILRQSVQDLATAQALNSTDKNIRRSAPLHADSAKSGIQEPIPVRRSSKVDGPLRAVPSGETRRKRTYNQAMANKKNDDDERKAKEGKRVKRLQAKRESKIFTPEDEQEQMNLFQAAAACTHPQTPVLDRSASTSEMGSVKNEKDHETPPYNESLFNQNPASSVQPPHPAGDANDWMVHLKPETRKTLKQLRQLSAEQGHLQREVTPLRARRDGLVQELDSFTVQFQPIEDRLRQIPQNIQRLGSVGASWDEMLRLNFEQLQLLRAAVPLRMQIELIRRQVREHNEYLLPRENRLRTINEDMARLGNMLDNKAEGSS